MNAPLDIKDLENPATAIGPRKIKMPRNYKAGVSIPESPEQCAMDNSQEFTPA